MVKLGGLAPDCARQRGRERKDRAPHRIGPCTRAGGPERHRISPLRNRALTSSRRRRPVLYPSRPRLPTAVSHTHETETERRGGGEGREGGGTRESTRAHSRTSPSRSRLPLFHIGVGWSGRSGDVICIDGCLASLLRTEEMLSMLLRRGSEESRPCA